MTENALSILIVIFSAELQQTEISERKLFIFHLGCHCETMETLNQDNKNCVNNAANVSMPWDDGSGKVI